MPRTQVSIGRGTEQDIKLITEILNAYYRKSTLERLPFFLGVLGLSILGGLLALAVRLWVLPEGNQPRLWLSIVVQIVATILVLPLVIARLRNIGWHPWVSLLIFIPIPFDLKLWIALAPDGGGSVPIPGPIILFAPLIFFVHLFFLLTLLFWKGKAAN